MYLKYKINFIKHFFRPEFNELAGKRYSRALWLGLIFLLSFLALGIGASMLGFLKAKMDDPFVRFVKVTVPYGVEVDIKDFEADTLKAKYNYRMVTPYFTQYFSIADKQGTSVSAFGRRVNTSDEFYQYLANTDHKLISTQNYFDDKTYCCIITQAFLEKLGYSKSELPYLSIVKRYNNKDVRVPLAVAAVVNNLPDQLQMLINEKVYTASREGDYFNINSRDHNNYLRVYLPDLTELPELLTQKGYERQDRESYCKGIVAIKNGVESPEAEYKELEAALGKDKVMRTYDYSRISAEAVGTPRADYLSFSFNDLEKVRAFAEWLSNKSDGKIEVDMDTIEAKENFNLFQVLISILSIALTLLSIFLAISFISNIVASHQEKNKKNIGTLKAFGLSNKYISYMYFAISGLLTSSAAIIGFFASWGLGLVGIKLFNKSMNYIIFPLYYYLLGMTLILVILKFVISRKLKNKTPGDLIYERDEN